MHIIYIDMHSFSLCIDIYCDILIYIDIYIYMLIYAVLYMFAMQTAKTLFLSTLQVIVCIC